MGSGFFYFRLTTFYMTKYLAIAFLITGFLVGDAYGGGEGQRWLDMNWKVQGEIQDHFE